MRKVASFPDILKPGMIIVRGGRLFVTEGATISIYSMKDFTRIKTFGKPEKGHEEKKGVSTVCIPKSTVRLFIFLKSRIGRGEPCVRPKMGSLFLKN
jgi:hypothetical protein